MEHPNGGLPNGDKDDNNVANIYRELFKVQSSPEPTSFGSESGKNNDKRGIEETEEGKDKPSMSHPSNSTRIRVDTNGGKS